jgi:hypothetical protein
MKLNMRGLFYLLLFFIITSCYKSKSDLQGLWKLQSYISIEGEKIYIDSLDYNNYWLIDEDLYVKSIEFRGSDSIYHKKILINKNENNISFGLKSIEKVTYFIENDSLYIYPLGQYLPEQLNTPYTEELIFVKIKK